jgi:hypothetical protein
LGTLLTAGLFLPVWLLADMAGALRPWRCQVCGQAAPRSLAGLLMVGLVLAVWVAAIFYLVSRLRR